ncbi:MAG: ATP-binding cassette domain-containing protein [Candidatus Eremiobacteraeota bacterium]|nr:ATP-binding cassette domain-containing protein [Candidatus Eremiobacteraeota bacterium]
MIELKEVSKVFLAEAGRYSVSFHISEGETLILPGTSGWGKSTTMKMLNRLIEPASGEIFIKGVNVLDIDPIKLRVGIGYGIQNIGLFPYMTIKENIEIIPKLVGWTPDDRLERVEELMNIVGLPPENFIDRYPSALSGGQKQRVGVTRAIVADPPIILMDEPFGPLAPITRRQAQRKFASFACPRGRLSPLLPRKGGYPERNRSLILYSIFPLS